MIVAVPDARLHPGGSSSPSSLMLSSWCPEPASDTLADPAQTTEAHVLSVLIPPSSP